jgi:hypothetical protein
MCIRKGTLQAYLDGELEPEQHETVVAHLDACEQCRARAAVAAGRHARVAIFMADRASDTNHDSTMVALARFRERRGSTRPGGVHARERALAPRFAPVRVAAGVLAVVAIGFLLAGHLTRQLPANGRLAATRNVAPPMVAKSAEDAAPVALISTGADRTTAPGASRRPHPVRRRAESNPYFLLTPDVGPPEMGMVVRVRMPLSMLTTAAGTVPADAAEPEVEADVLVGQDGRARAVRFVNQTLTRLTPGGK